MLKNGVLNLLLQVSINGSAVASQDKEYILWFTCILDESAVLQTNT